MGGARWPKNPRVLAGRLRRAQTPLRSLGIEIAFSREGRAGSRIIRLRSSVENSDRTVGEVHGLAPDCGPALASVCSARER